MLGLFRCPRSFLDATPFEVLVVLIVNPFAVAADTHSSVMQADNFVALILILFAIVVGK